MRVARTWGVGPVLPMGWAPYGGTLTVFFHDRSSPTWPCTLVCLVDRAWRSFSTLEVCFNGELESIQSISAIGMLGC